MRSLGPKDFEFFFSSRLKKRFLPTEVITPKDQDQLWGWFGPLLQKIRYTKFLLPMWGNGLFWGLISKQDSEQILQNYGAGTFLLRFSERMVGAMTVAYKQSANTVRHYLLKDKDTAGQGRSLPQFIRETPSLVQFLKITIDDNFQRRLTVVEKHQALQKIGTNRPKHLADGKGLSYYDEEILELGLETLTLHS